MDSARLVRSDLVTERSNHERSSLECVSKYLFQCTGGMYLDDVLVAGVLDHNQKHHRI